MKKRKDTNLAEGEVTGHAHRCAGAGVAVFDETDGTRLLEAPSGCEVTHEEHKTHILPPGRYTATIAHEQDHAADDARRVRD